MPQIIESNRSPKYKTIENNLLEKIKRGEFLVGQRVPTEHFLSEQYNVSRLTARKAMERLEQKGFLDRKAGQGSFVKDWKDTLKNNGGMVKCRNISFVLIEKDGVKTADPECWDSQLIREAAIETEKYGFHLSVCPVSNEALVKGDVPVSLKGNSCGAIVDGHVSDMAIGKLLEIGVPVILAGNYFHKHLVPEVKCDFEQAGNKITKAMLNYFDGHIWLIGQPTVNYAPTHEFSIGYQNAILSDSAHNRLVLYNQCLPEQCSSIAEQVKRMESKEHCFICFNMTHYLSLKKYLKDNSSHMFVGVGRHHPELAMNKDYMECSMDPMAVAKETIKQIVLYSQEKVPIESRIFDLKVEESNDNRRPFRFSWV